MKREACKKKGGVHETLTIYFGKLVLKKDNRVFVAKDIPQGFGSNLLQ